MSVVEQLYAQYSRHLNRCTACTFSDIYVGGCAVGRYLERELEDAKEELFLRQELEGTVTT